MAVCEWVIVVQVGPVGRGLRGLRLPFQPMHTSALVLFSGGQDSTTCLAHALARYERVETLAFDYGQRHKVELDARLNVLAAIKARFAVWAPRMGEDHLLDAGILGQISETALTRDTAIAWKARACPTLLCRDATCSS